MSKKFFGSIQEKLSRKPSKPTLKSNDPYGTMGGDNPYMARVIATATPDLVQDPNDMPPAYTPDKHSNTVAAPQLSASHAGGSASRSSVTMRGLINGDADQYAFLGMFDTVFLIDDSASMTGSRWREVKTLLRAITPICTARDKDGVDLYFLNHRNHNTAAGNPGEGKAPGGYYGITDPETVADIFSRVTCNYSTPTGTRIHSILRHYVRYLAAHQDDAKPVNIIVITDGQPDDEPDQIIAQHARKLDELEAPPHQVGIQFFQVGNDPAATEALRNLDDDLPRMGVRDMVDTVSWSGGGSRALTADAILKVVLGAVVRRLDRDLTR